MKGAHYLIYGLMSASLYCSATPLKLSRHKVIIPKVGLSFNGFEELQKQHQKVLKPLKPGKDDIKNPVEASYDPIELWHRDQVKGIWKNDHVAVTVAYLSNPYPVELIDGQKQGFDITPSLYARWKSTVGKEFKGTSDDFRLWIQYLLDCEIDAEYRDVKGAEYDMVEYISAVKPEHNKIFVIQVPGKKREFAVLNFEFKHAARPKELALLIEALKTIQLYYPAKGVVEKLELEKGDIVEDKARRRISEKPWITGDIKGMKGWSYTRNENSIVLSDSSSEEIAQGVLGWFERSRQMFQLFFPSNKKQKQVDIIRLFKHRHGLRSYAGPGNIKWTGFWNPNLEEILLPDAHRANRFFKRRRRSNRKDLLQVLIHESFLQYLSTTLNGQTTAPWFSEGTAEVLDKAKYYSNNSYKIKIADNSKLYRTLKIELYLGNCDLKSIMRMDNYQFYDSETVEYNTRIAWGLMFYLYKGTLVTDKKRYAKIPYLYYQSRRKGMTDAEATLNAWKGIEMSQFKADFEAFWRNADLVKEASRFSLYDSLMKSRSDAK